MSHMLRGGLYLLAILFSLGLSGCPQQGRPGVSARPPAKGAAPEPVVPVALPSCPPEAPVVWRNVAGQVVVLDAGHGGHDEGASHFGLREKDINLDLARRTADSLRARGVVVHLTRDADAFVPLDQRSAFANRFPNSILVSIHVNASQNNPAASGVETFVLSNAVSDTQRGQVAARRYTVPGSDPVQGRQALANLAVRSRSRGPVLAGSLQKSLVGRLGEADRGVKTGNLAVLRETYFCPAVLVEVGFLSHGRTAMAMRTEEWRRRASDALAEGIIDFLRQPE